MKKLGNDNQICFVFINEETLVKNIKYYQEKKVFGIVWREEGFYKVSSFDEPLIPINGTPSNCFVSDKNMMKKANILIEYSSGRKEKIYFNTNKEMYVYIKREFQGNNWRRFE